MKCGFIFQLYAIWKVNVRKWYQIRPHFKSYDLIKDDKRKTIYFTCLWTTASKNSHYHFKGLKKGWDYGQDQKLRCPILYGLVRFGCHQYFLKRSWAGLIKQLYFSDQNENALCHTLTPIFLNYPLGWRFNLAKVPTEIKNSRDSNSTTKTSLIMR